MTLVAAIQFEPDLLNVSKNVRTGLQLAFEAAGQGAKIIVMPELATSGYVIRSKDEAFRCAQEKNGYQTEVYTTLTRKFGCYVVLGYVELSGGELYNSAVVIGPNGVVGNAQKHNLWGSDYLWASSSDALHPCVITPFGRLGVLLCRDVMNKERDSHPMRKKDHRFYRKGSIDHVALLTNWGTNFGYPDSSWVELAEELDANVIVSNRVGEERDMDFKGGSCIVTRDLDVKVRGSNFDDTAIVLGDVA